MQVIGAEEPMAESDSESDEDQIVTVRVAPTDDLQQNTIGTQHDIAGDESPSEDHDYQVFTYNVFQDNQRPALQTCSICPGLWY